MKVIENNKVKESLYAQCGVALEASASELTQGPGGMNYEGIPHEDLGPKDQTGIKIIWKN